MEKAILVKIVRFFFLLLFFLLPRELFCIFFFSTGPSDDDEGDDVKTQLYERCCTYDSPYGNQSSD